MKIENIFWFVLIGVITGLLVNVITQKVLNAAPARQPSGGATGSW